jgi:putative heme-binding domain-containing protein
MEALKDRTVKVDVPYTLKWSEVIKILEKDYGPGKVRQHVAPHTLEIAALWQVLTCMQDDKESKLSLVEKAELYDGKLLPGWTEDAVKELKDNYPGEGMECGISIRYVQDKVSNCLSNLQAGKTRNWEYAQYQTEKIDLSLRLAIERRPKRAKSAQPFLDETLPEVMRAIKTKDGPTFDAALDRLRAGCIQCHRAENVLYMGQLFATIRPTPQATADAIQEYKKKLTPDYLRSANRSEGRVVFSKNCANCHRLFGEGSDNGPDLTGLQRSNLDYLLTRIIDPSGMIGHDYQAVVVVTTKGQTVTGLVKHDDQKTLAIQTLTEKVSIPKEEIEERSLSKVSFMPEGILQQLSDEQVRDLIGYLQGPDQVPLPPEKTGGPPK